MKNTRRKIIVIAWKMLIMRKREYCKTIIEIFLPLFLYVLIAITTKYVPMLQIKYINETKYFPQEPLNISFEVNLFYAPNTTVVNDVMQKVKENVQPKLFEYFPTEEEMFDRIFALQGLNIFNAIVIVFDDFTTDEKHLHYRICIKFNDNDIGNLFSSQPPYTILDKEYISSGFVAIQKYIDFAYIDKVTSNKLALKNIDINLESMPFPPRDIDNPFVTDAILPLYILFSFYMLFCMTFLTPVILEKTSGIRQLMIAMGLPSWIYWLGWFFYSMCTNIFTITIMTMLMTINFTDSGPTYFDNSNGLIIWIFFFFIYISILALIFLVTVIFNKIEYAIYVSLMIWILPHMLLGSFVPINSLPVTLMILFMLFPNICVRFGIKTIIYFERIGGVHFSNMWSKPNTHSVDPSVGLILVMLLLDSVIYFILTWYFMNLFPGDFGIPKRWYFPFVKLFRIKLKENDEPEPSTSKRSPNVEPAAKNQEAGIQILNLRKKFKNKYVVDGINLDVYSNQITVLLGHNGAGKTTTMNIIAGIIPATSGIIFVNGFNMKTELHNAQQSIGVCFQHNLEFSGLTVMEHLLFFSMLRGLSMSEARTESLQYLEISNLASKAKNTPLTLSGGMRRKLSLGMAMIGKSKVALLDEPTSGLDPEARKDLRNFLLGMRGERTILITTHYMDEADILGDRIAIMHHGQLMCYGSSLFLKNFYGAGYTLSVLTELTDTSAITNAVKSFVSSAFVKSANTGIIVYALPTTNTNYLSNLFKSLDTNKSNLGIANFAITVTSLDDVFLKVGELADFDKDISKKYNFLQESNVQLTQKFAPNYLQTFKALFRKRLKYYRHNKCTLIFHSLLLPIFLFLLSCMLVSVVGIGKDTIDLKLGMYEQAESFYSYESSMDALAKCYHQIVTKERSKASPTSDIYNSILDASSVNEIKYHKTLITGAQFNNQMKITAMYGQYAVHGPPISVNLITNSLLQWLADDSYSISVANKPLPFSPNMSIFIIFMPICVSLGYSIMVVRFVLLLQEERLSGFKHLQIMVGASRFLYWMSVYVFDILMYLIVNLLILIMLCAIYNGKAYGNLYTIANIGLILLLFGLSYLPFCYLFHFAASRACVANGISTFFIFFGVVGPLVSYFLPLFNMICSICDDMKFLVRLLPNYACVEGLQNTLSKSYAIHQWNTQKDFFTNNEHICSSNPESEMCKNIFSYYRGEKSISIMIYYLLGEIFLYWGFLFLIDYGILGHSFNILCGPLLSGGVKITNDLDSDVVEERNRVKQQIDELSEKEPIFEQPRMEDILLVSNIHHWFRTTYAVRGLNFGIKKGECFGLLGLNGAGKTTTFKILTGEIPPTIGNAYFEGISLYRNKSEFLKYIGYCPQFDGLNMELTINEMLQLFGTIRGIEHNEIDSHIEKWLKIFDLKMYENVQCGKLSGGTKRKVSSAVALIGNPILIMLDEPTSGIDSVSRRNLWNILDVFRKAGHSILLTSQSMDECEALCNRLAIMVDGHMKCIGNIAHLKNKFSQGCIIKIKLTSIASPEDITAIKNIIEAKYICILKDENFGMLTYHITSPNVTLADVFLFLESLKQGESMVEDFSASSTSLEDIFLAFAKEKK